MKKPLAVLLGVAAVGLTACGYESVVEKAETHACAHSFVQELKPDQHTIGTKKVNYWVKCQDGSVHYIRS